MPYVSKYLQNQQHGNGIICDQQYFEMCNSPRIGPICTAIGSQTGGMLHSSKCTEGFEFSTNGLIMKQLADILSTSS